MLGWLMLSLTESKFYVGLVGFDGGLPILLVSIPARILIDRAHRRTVPTPCQAALAVLGAMLFAMAATGAAQPWQLLLAGWVNGTLMTVNNTTYPADVADTTLAVIDGRAGAVIPCGGCDTRCSFESFIDS